MSRRYSSPSCNVNHSGGIIEARMTAIKIYISSDPAVEQWTIEVLKQRRDYLKMIRSKGRTVTDEEISDIESVIKQREELLSRRNLQS
jgi:hypothetical protein